MVILAGKLGTVSSSVSCGTVEVAGDRDGGHRNDRRGGDFLFQNVVFGFTVSQAQPPTVIVDDNAGVIGVGERRRTAVVGGIVEVPVRGGELPDELVEVESVLPVATLSAFGREVELIPPTVF